MASQCGGTWFSLEDILKEVTDTLEKGVAGGADGGSRPLIIGKLRELIDGQALAPQGAPPPPVVRKNADPS